MSVEFEDQNTLMSRQTYYSSVPTGLAGFLVRKRICKDEKSANVALGSIAGGLLLVAAGLFVWSSFLGREKTKPVYKMSEDLFNKLPQEIQLKILE